jgi:hypothetical protein
MKKISSFYEKEDNFVSHENDCDDTQRVGILGRACQIGKKMER